MNSGLIAWKAKGAWKAWKAKAAPLNVERAGGQARESTSKPERLTAAEKPLAGQLMSSSPIRSGTPKGARSKISPGRHSRRKAAPRGAGKGSSPADAFKSRHKHLKYQL